MRRLLFAATALVALGAGGQAQAICTSTSVSSLTITSPDPGAGTTCPIFASGSTVQIVFGYVSAGDVDTLQLNGTQLINNQTDSLGKLVSLTGLTPGAVIPFGFTNVGTPGSYVAGTLAPDGVQHIAVQSSYIDFNNGAGAFLTSADVSAALAEMLIIDPSDPTFKNWIWVGMEDEPRTGKGSDFDYNDLIFAMEGIGPGSVPDPSPQATPEPASLALLGIGLIGLGLVRIRCRKAA